MNEKFLNEVANIAKEAHEGQYRLYSHVPYFEHCKRVADEVRKDGYANEILIAAAYLHDVVEDTNIDICELRRRLVALNYTNFSDEGFEEVIVNPILKLVRQLTNPSTDYNLPRKLRKKMDRIHLSRVSDEAKVIKLADRIDNISETLDYLKNLPRWENLADEFVDFAKLYCRETLDLIPYIGDDAQELTEKLYFLVKELKNAIKQT